MAHDAQCSDHPFPGKIAKNRSSFRNLRWLRAMFPMGLDSKAPRQRRFKGWPGVGDSFSFERVRHAGQHEQFSCKTVSTANTALVCYHLGLSVIAFTR